MSYSEDLRRQAHHLARREPRRPSQASLRRAVSTAYYSLFHLLIDEATIAMFGAGPQHRGHRQVLARAFSHQAMVEACKSFRGGVLPQAVVAAIGTTLVEPDLRKVASAFVTLQEERHRADYNMALPFSKAEVLNLLVELDEATAAWRRVGRGGTARFFLMALPLWDKLRR